MRDSQVQPASCIFGFDVKGTVVSRKCFLRPLAVGERGTQLVPQGVIAARRREQGMEGEIANK